VKRVSDTHIE